MEKCQKCNFTSYTEGEMVAHGRHIHGSVAANELLRAGQVVYLKNVRESAVMKASLKGIHVNMERTNGHEESITFPLPYNSFFELSSELEFLQIRRGFVGQKILELESAVQRMREEEIEIHTRLRELNDS